MSVRVDFPTRRGTAAATIALLAAAVELPRVRSPTPPEPDPVAHTEIVRMGMPRTFLDEPAVLNAVFLQLPVRDQSFLGHLLNAHRQATTAERINGAIEAALTRAGDTHSTVRQAYRFTRRQADTASRLFDGAEGEPESDLTVLTEIAEGYASGQGPAMPVLTIAGIPVAVEPGLAPEYLRLRPHVAPYSANEPGPVGLLALSVDAQHPDLSAIVLTHFQQIAAHASELQSDDAALSARLQRASEVFDSFQEHLEGIAVGITTAQRQAEAVFDQHCAQLNVLLAHPEVAQPAASAATFSELSRIVADFDHRAENSRRTYYS